jgi:hypothetical protein
MDDRPAASGVTAPEPSLVPWTDEIYDGHVLFHGEGFKVIQQLHGVSEQGSAATLSNTNQAGWGETGWETDPAALDGGLQLALLWSKKVLGGAGLPMAVGSYHTYRSGPPEGSVRAVLHARETSRDRAVADIVFTDAADITVAELRGVEVILRPGESTRVPTA